MYLIITRSFPPSLGGMQNLMWGLVHSLSKINLIKVFADYEINHEEFDSNVSFTISRVGGPKLIRKYRKQKGIIEFGWNLTNYLEIIFLKLFNSSSAFSLEKYLLDNFVPVFLFFKV